MADASTTTVRARRDGVHIVLENESSGRTFFVREVGGERNEGGRIEPGERDEIVTTMPPGAVVVGCFQSTSEGFSAPRSDQRFARIRIVDPARLSVAAELECEEVLERFGVNIGKASSVDDFGALARRVPGVDQGDDLQRPGYPETGLHFEQRIVVRDGRRIARLTFLERRGKQRVSVDACPGSGIGTNA